MNLCIHCRRCPITRSRGLCWNCFYNLDIRSRYPADTKYASKGSGLIYNGPPPFPTQAFPGTIEKFEILTLRAALGFDLFHPEDSVHH